jgi:hypothetical protein
MEAVKRPDELNEASPSTRRPLQAASLRSFFLRTCVIEDNSIYSMYAVVCCLGILIFTVLALFTSSATRFSGTSHFTWAV